MVTVIAVMLIGGTFKLKKQVQDLQDELKKLHKILDNQERIGDEKFRITENLFNTVDARIDTETRELYRTIDSRFDKLENKLFTKK
jgi:Skp family chaperone for outer membrane proteins